MRYYNLAECKYCVYFGIWSCCSSRLRDKNNWILENVSWGKCEVTVRLGKKTQRGNTAFSQGKHDSSHIKGNVSCFPKGQKEHQQTEVAVGKFRLTLRKNLLDKSSAAKAQGLPSHQWGPSLRDQSVTTPSTESRGIMLWLQICGLVSKANRFS